MFSIFKRKYPAKPADFSSLHTDMHSHLLPGIDDGAKDLQQSILLKKGLEDLGFQQFITTPHIYWDLYKNTDNTIGQALNTLQEGNQHRNIKAAAEYFMDDYFDELLDGGKPLRTLGGKRVLVEFSFVAPPMDLSDLIFKLQIKGYEPVLAHPERYNYYMANKIAYEDFKSMGCLFQINLLSLTGYYGKTTQELGQHLISKNFIDFAGTDLHHLKHLEALRQSKSIAAALQPLVESGRLLNTSLAL
jgi:tyrosine-protein phosphatase YwqE